MFVKFCQAHNAVTIKISWSLDTRYEKPTEQGVIAIVSWATIFTRYLDNVCSSQYCLPTVWHIKNIRISVLDWRCRIRIAATTVGESSTKATIQNKYLCGYLSRIHESGDVVGSNRCTFKIIHLCILKC